MVQSHRNLARAFARGDTSGQSSSMSIMELADGVTALVGYGHAVYAIRDSDGTVYRFDGWAFKGTRPRNRSGSMTVKANHWPALRGSFADVAVSDTSPSTSMERHLKESADVLTGDAHKSAPSTSNAMGALTWAAGAAP